MSAGVTITTTRTGAVLAAVVLCLASGGIAAESSGTPLLFAGETLGLASGREMPAAESLPMMIDRSGGLLFDLGGSETRKLQLQLDQPLSLQAGMDSRILDSGSNLLGLDATLSLPVNNQLSLGVGVGRHYGASHFQSLGSIQCINGTLRADSYTASGCRFVNDTFATSEQQLAELGAHLDFRSATASVKWFTQQSDLDQAGVRQLNRVGGHASMAENLLSPNLGNPLLAPAVGDPLQYLNSEASGVDLNFKVGVTTDTRGDVHLGLAFSRILDAGYDGIYTQGAEAFSWTLAEPFNSARMNLEWSKGAFSTGIQGYYRDSVDFLNRDSVDALTTFDVHFTWRTPWNANLSVGASNVLNAGADSTLNTDSQPADPLESIYGRIPYVRYKQDL
ncbi:MAG: hypothetical protein EHM68_11475 [Lysobacterales bacterium]|nr:MAG: hypothetical protein EHM68_11475 [Xanthomonadales bacterium]